MKMYGVPCATKRDTICPIVGNYTVTGAPNPFLVGPKEEWHEIYRHWGHEPHWCPKLKKYQKKKHIPLCDFYKSMRHDVNNYRSSQLIQGHMVDSFKVQIMEKNNVGEQGGFHGFQIGGYK